MNKSKTNTKQIAAVAMLSALAYVISLFKLPIQFLSFEVKDFVIAVTGFIFGPVYALAAAIISSFAEMLTVSSTGIIGFIMNVLASACFACTAALIYRRQRTMRGAVIGLACGCLLMTAVMLLWNYFLTPLYLGAPREVVAGMLLPLLLPFNLAKSAVNMAVTLLLYKPIVTALRRAGFAEQPENEAPGKVHIGIIFAGVLLILTGICALAILR